MENTEPVLPRITVMGVGCTLLSDEGFGVKVVTELFRRYDFPAHVSLTKV